MLRFLKIIFFCFGLNSIPATIFAQSKKALEAFEKGIEAEKKGKKINALEFYEKAVDNDSTFADAHFKIGQLRITSNSIDDKSIYHYRKALLLQPENPNFQTAYAFLGPRLFKQKKYEEALPYLQKAQKNALKNSPLLSQLNKQIETCEFIKSQKSNPQKIDIQEVKGLESFAAFTYFPALTADGNLIFFTARSETGDENLFFAQKENGVFKTPLNLSGKINTAQNEGTCSISADGRILVFTICDGLKGLGSCDLYYSKKIGTEWSVPYNMGERVNSIDWESQPSLSADGRTLYFSSDRGGGFGKKDLYVSYLNDTGEWSIAKNLGKTVNTVADELSPFIHANGHTLFFASDGHVGMGGLDMFVCEQKETVVNQYFASQNWTKPENLGWPINKDDDQVAFIVSSDGRNGYFSSGERKFIKLYSFELPETLFNKFKKADYLKGIVYDANTKKPIGASIELFDLKTNQLIEKLNADAITGEYTAVLPNGSQYALYVNKERYFFKSLSFDYTSNIQNKGKNLDILLEPIKTNTVERLNNIFFDSGKDVLRPESAVELQKLLTLIQNNPSIKIEISGHTDDIGSEQTNLQLSQRRALAVVNYLQQNSVDLNRLQSVGFGESKPILPNVSEENRQINRRIEMRIL